LAAAHAPAQSLGGRWRRQAELAADHPYRPSTGSLAAARRR